LKAKGVVDYRRLERQGKSIVPPWLLVLGLNIYVGIGVIGLILTVICVAIITVGVALVIIGRHGMNRISTDSAKTTEHKLPSNG